MSPMELNTLLDLFCSFSLLKIDFLWFRYREYDLAHLKLVFEFSIYNVWKSVQYGVCNGLDTAYWGFLRLGTTFDIFQNIHILYLRYSVLSFIPLWSLESAGTDTPNLLDGCGVLVSRIPKRNKAFVEGAWSDGEDRDDQQKEATYLMAFDSQEESLKVTFDESLPKPWTSPLIDDDVIEEHVVQDHDRMQNPNCDLEEVIPRVENIKEIRDHLIDQVIGELYEKTL
ncbi:hypothetical protein Tco_1285996 [Tanacetum coccineum]